MFQKLLTQLFLFFLRIGVVFAPREEYEHKISEIQPLSEKTAIYDTAVWEYRSVTSESTGNTYWYYTTKNDAGGQPLVCIHGLLLDGRTFTNLAEFMPGKRLVALNLLQQSDLYTGAINDYVIMVTDFLRTLEIHSCSLFGFSFGGVVALRMVAHAPDDISFERCILAATILPGATREARKNSRRTNKWIKGFKDYQLYWFIEKVTKFSAKNYGKDKRDAFEKMLAVKQPNWYRQVSASVADYNALDDASSVACPVLILHAEKDVFLDRKMRSIMKTVFPNVRYRTITNSTHTMVFTMPEIIARHINEFTEDASGE